MIITLSRRTASCQSVAEVLLTGVAPLGGVSHRFTFFFTSANNIVESMSWRHNDAIARA